MASPNMRSAQMPLSKMCSRSRSESARTRLQERLAAVAADAAVRVRLDERPRIEELPHELAVGHVVVPEVELEERHGAEVLEQHHPAADDEDGAIHPPRRLPRRTEPPELGPPVERAEEAGRERAPGQGAEGEINDDEPHRDEVEEREQAAERDGRRQADRAVEAPAARLPAAEGEADDGAPGDERRENEQAPDRRRDEGQPLPQHEAEREDGEPAQARREAAEEVVELDSRRGAHGAASPDGGRRCR
jgi:hypothetical protein